jgi:Uma2 family endonuclease
MAIYVTDPIIEQRLLAQRAESGADRYDEVWEGTYMMAPMPNLEHQQLVIRLATIFQETLGWSGGASVLAGCNVSDRQVDWQQNYRVPDIAVVFQGGAARDCGTHFCGGPDFVLEVASPSDRTYEKLEFYGRLGVRELLIIDRDPWKLQLYRHDGTVLVCIASVDVSQQLEVVAQCLPFSFRLEDDSPRPSIAVQHTSSGKQWHV